MIFSIQEYNEAFVDDEDEYTPTPLPETGNEDPPIPERTQYKEPDVTPRTPDIFVRPDADLQQVSPHNSPNVMKYSRTLLSRTRLFRITAYLEVKIWSLFYHGTMTKGNKIMWKRGEIAPKEQFLLFSTLFYIYIFLTSGVKLHILLLNVVVQFIVLLTLSTLICLGTDISKCCSVSLGIRDNESRLYTRTPEKAFFTKT